jgi:hypothetical protein
MPNTITTYNTFSGGTKARATQVNQNFSNHRGILLPINEDSASASHNTHDLGSSDHRWLTAYANTLNLRGATSTVDFKVVPNTSATAGGVDFMFGSSTIASFDTNGLVRSGVTTTAAFSFSVTSSTLTVTASDLTIQTNGRPVHISIFNSTAGVLSVQAATTGSYNCVGDITLYRDGALIHYWRIQVSLRSGATNTVHFIHGAGAYHFIDAPAAGSHTYRIQAFAATDNKLVGTNQHLRALLL